VTTHDLYVRYVISDYRNNKKVWSHSSIWTVFHPHPHSGECIVEAPLVSSSSGKGTIASLAPFNSTVFGECKVSNPHGTSAAPTPLSGQAGWNSTLLSMKSAKGIIASAILTDSQFYVMSGPPAPSTNQVPASTSSQSTTTTTTTPSTFTNTWSFSATGSNNYTESGTIAIGQVERFQQGLTNGNATAGSACTIDAQTDAVAPVMLTLTNTTPNFSMTGQYSIGEPLTDQQPLEGELDFTSGSQCFGSSTGSNSAGVTCTLGAGQTCTVFGFVILPNYYSPAFPSGDSSELASVALTVVAEPFSNGWQTCTGPGSELNTGCFFNINGAPFSDNE